VRGNRQAARRFPLLLSELCGEETPLATVPRALSAGAAKIFFARDRQIEPNAST
jgi:hypothetical protein